MPCSSAGVVARRPQHLGLLPPGTACPRQPTPQAAGPPTPTRKLVEPSRPRVLRSFRSPSTSRTDNQDLDGPRPRQKQHDRRQDIAKRDADLDARKRVSPTRRSSRQVQLAAVTALLGEARQQCDSALGAGGELEWRDRGRVPDRRPTPSAHRLAARTPGCLSSKPKRSGHLEPSRVRTGASVNA